MHEVQTAAVMDLPRSLLIEDTKNHERICQASPKKLGFYLDVPQLLFERWFSAFVQAFDFFCAESVAVDADIVDQAIPIPAIFLPLRIATNTFGIAQFSIYVKAHFFRFMDFHGRACLIHRVPVAPDIPHVTRRVHLRALSLLLSSAI